MPSVWVIRDTGHAGSMHLASLMHKQLGFSMYFEMPVKRTSDGFGALRCGLRQVPPVPLPSAIARGCGCFDWMTYNAELGERDMVMPDATYIFRAHEAKRALCGQQEGGPSINCSATAVSRCTGFGVVTEIKYHVAAPLSGHAVAIHNVPQAARLARLNGMSVVGLQRTNRVKHAVSW